MGLKTGLLGALFLKVLIIPVHAEIWSAKQVRSWLAHGSCYRADLPPSGNTPEALVKQICYPQKYKPSHREKSQIANLLNNNFSIQGGTLASALRIVLRSEVNAPTFIFNAFGEEATTILGSEAARWVKLWGDTIVALPLKFFRKPSLKVTQTIRKMSKTYEKYITSEDPKLRRDDQMIAVGHMFSLYRSEKGKPELWFIPPTHESVEIERSSHLDDEEDLSAESGLAHGADEDEDADNLQTSGASDDSYIDGTQGSCRLITTDNPDAGVSEEPSTPTN